jgi:exosortase
MIGKSVMSDQPNVTPQLDSTATGRSDLESVISPMIWVGLLTALAYWPTLSYLVYEWMHNEDMGHGFFVPLVVLYIGWNKRGELISPIRTSYAGLAIMIYAALQLYVATLGAELFLARTAMVFSIFGAVLYLLGAKNFRRLLFPLVLLFFMVPLPAIIYNQVTFPLQLFASRVAENALTLLGIPVLREGNVLELPSQRLSVVEACSGIRSLLSLSFLSLVYGYFFDSRKWMKIALLVATVPIAVAANAARVTITGILSEQNPELARGFFHTAEGWIIFLVATAMLLATHGLINLVAQRFSRHAA